MRLNNGFRCQYFLYSAFKASGTIMVKNTYVDVLGTTVFKLFIEMNRFYDFYVGNKNYKNSDKIIVC